jgi:hypothetical protein
MALLFPQIDRSLAKTLILQREFGDAPQFHHPNQIFSPVGGTRASERQIQDLGLEIRAIADDLGFPRLAATEIRRQFDRRVACLLHSNMRITPNEAARPGVWQFICCVVAPTIVEWRFPSTDSVPTIARFLGGTRNAFSRLWWRAEILSYFGAEDPYRLVNKLNEDELVQIMERPSLAGCRPLAKGLAEEFLLGFGDRLRTESGSGRMAIMRETAKRLLRLGAVISPDVLSESQLRAIIKIELSQAVRSLASQTTT